MDVASWEEEADEDMNEELIDHMDEIFGSDEEE